MKRKKIKPLCLYLVLLVFPLVAFTTAHKFYLSVTNIDYSEKSDALQITTRLFVDDLGKVLEARYGIKADLATHTEAASANAYLEKYLREKFVLKLDGKVMEFNFLGKKYEPDMVICYMEIPKIGLHGGKTLEIQNELLTDLFDEQQNVVHFKIKDRKKSFVLIKSEPNGMLKL